MKTLFQQHSTAALALFCFLAGGLLAWLWLQPAPPSGKVLTVKEARQATQEALKAQADAKTLNTRGDTAAARAAAPYAAARQAEQQALTLHAHRHAPTPVPRAAADSAVFYTAVLSAY